MCNCEGAASLDFSDYYEFRPFLFYKMPIFTFSCMMYIVLTALSCWLECRHWAPYKAQHGQLVTPLAPIAASPEPTTVVATVPSGTWGNKMTVDAPWGQQVQVTIPAGLTSGQQFRAEITEQPASASTQATPPGGGWILPPAVNVACVKDWRQWEAVSTVWGLPRPLVNAAHGSGTGDEGADDSSSNPVHPDGQFAQQQTLAQAETVLEAQAASPVERARLAHKWLSEKSYKYPSRASCASAFFSLFFANAVGLLNMAFGVLIYWHSCNVCCCGPLLRCWDGKQARKRQQTTTTKRCANADNTSGCSGCCFIYAVVVYVFGIGIAGEFGWRQGYCYRDCELTGFDMMGLATYFAQKEGNPGLGFLPTMRSNAMEPVLDNLALPQYYGLYSDFADKGFTQPCTLQTAVEQISGPTGMLHEPLVREFVHWCMDGVCNHPYQYNSTGVYYPDRGPQLSASEIVAREAQYLKDWIGRKGARLRSILEERCDSDGACLPGATCLTPGSVGCRTEQTCVQGSLAASCVELEQDECGCVEGQGWSKHAGACAMGASTSHAEAEQCAQAQG